MYQHCSRLRKAPFKRVARRGSSGHLGQHRHGFGDFGAGYRNNNLDRCRIQGNVRRSGTERNSLGNIPDCLMDVNYRRGLANPLTSREGPLTVTTLG